MVGIAIPLCSLLKGKGPEIFSSAGEGGRKSGPGDFERS